MDGIDAELEHGYLAVASEPDGSATAVRELLAAMRQAYEEDPTTRALIDAMVGCVTNADGRPYSWNNLLLLAGQCRERGLTPTQVAAFGAWLYARWQRRRNAPINRVRRGLRESQKELSSRLHDAQQDLGSSLRHSQKDLRSSLRHSQKELRSSRFADAVRG